MEAKFIIVVDQQDVTHNIAVNHIVEIADFGSNRFINLTNGTGINTVLTNEHIVELIKNS